MMQKAYSRIIWVNYPQTTTPLNDVNLNKVDLGLDTVDDRVVAMDTTKANQSDLLTCVASISLDSATGIMTITLKNGTSTTIDTKLEKIAINFDYDDDPTSPHYQQLVIELDDGTYKYVDMSALVTQYEFTNTSTIAWTVGSGGVITADVVDGSITAQKLQPNYLADVTAQAGIATAAAGSASADATLAESWAIGGTGTRTGEDTNNAKYWSDQAQAVSNAVSYTPQVLTTSQKAQARDNIDALDEAHANEEIASVSGAHGFRYNNNVLEYYDSVSQAWVEVPTATKYALANPTSVSVGVGDTKLVLTWTDPSDLVIGGTLAAEWAGTKIIRKVGSAPTDENDGTLVVNETTRNQYSSNGYEDTGLTNGTTYYYGFFPYTTDGVYNYNVTDDGTPTQSTGTVTLSIESAASDTVAITDSNGNAVVGSPIVTDNTGSGSGTVTIVPNEVYTFTSSVAQRIDGQAGYYSKNVTLTNSLSQSVDLYPDVAVYWYGNLLGYSWTNNSQYLPTNDIDFQTNRMHFSSQGQNVGGSTSVRCYKCISEQITFTNNTLKMIYDFSKKSGADSNTHGGFGVDASLSSASTSRLAESPMLTTVSNNQTATVNVTNGSGNVYVYDYYYADLYVYALIIE